MTRTRAALDRFAAALTRPAWGVAWTLAVALFVLSVSLGSRAASGADSSGYVSQAALWARGTLVQTERLATAVPWPYAIATFAPLGYRPAPRGARIVPTYAPGLPLLMALFRVTCGPCAVYLVVPLCAGALLLLTYALGLRLGSPLSAMAATILVATSPAVLFMVLWPMSDVPVAAFWLDALVLALGACPERAKRVDGRAVATGIVTGIAIMIRPNLAPLAIVPIALLAFRAWPLGRAAVIRAVAAAGFAIAPFVVAIAAINNYLYGGPLRSGYGAGGDAATLYSWSHIAPNLQRYSLWIFESQGPLIAVAAVALVLQLVWRARPERRLLAVFAALVVASYLPYLVFDAWWFLRFLLPALPILFLLGAHGVEALTTRLGARTQVLVTALFVAAMATHGVRFAVNGEVLGVGEGEQRYVDVGRFIRDTVSQKAVVLAMQHGGSIRYYAGHSTLRHDLLTTPRLDQAVELLRGLGSGPFLVLEDWEEQPFRERFKGHRAVQTLDQRLFAVLDSNTSVRIYDLGTQPLPSAPIRIPHLARTRCPGRFDD